jgi:hypothetical protein
MAVITHKNNGKGSQEEVLPHRKALTMLTKGDPSQRSMNNYAKATPGMNNQGSMGMFGFGPTQQ